MRKRSHVMYGIAFLFLLLSDVWIYQEYQGMYRLASRRNTEVHHLSGSLNVANTSVTLLAQSMSMSHQYENSKIPDVDIEDGDKRKYHLSEVLQKREPKMVVFFSSENCESCVSSIFANLETMGMDIKDNLIVVGEFENRRAVNAYLHRRKMSIKVYYKSSQQPIDILEKEGAPFMCMLTSDLVVHDVAFPVKEVPLFTRLYIKTIKEKYSL